MKKAKIGFWHRFKCFFKTMTTIVSVFVLFIIMCGWIGNCIIKSEEKKATELEIRHILVEGDQSAIDIEKIDQIESCGFTVRKIAISDKMIVFYMERENGKYLWIYDKSYGRDISVVPLIDDLSY